MPHSLCHDKVLTHHWPSNPMRCTECLSDPTLKLKLDGRPTVY